ncbi:MAG: hypothetical protein K8T90_17865 [Planctomycetes bacterium]|nr:hypothetical protein [Planctomycetota bacterium]
MRASVVRIFAMLVLAVFAGIPPARAGDAPLDPRALGAAREAARWVARQAQPAKGKGVATFPEYAESPDETPTSPLYAGSAGVLVFLENAAALLDDDALRALADRTAAGLLTESGKQQTGPGAAGLYTGDTGTAWALLVRWRLRKDKSALEGAQRIADRLLARARTGDDAGSWDDGYDIIGGAAGTSLLLLEVAADAPAEADRRKYADGALRAGRFLARRGTMEDADPPSKDRRLWWPTGKGQTRHYPNFSHGTAGVAYALARIAGATGDAECRDAAVAGGRWLLAHAQRTPSTLAWGHYVPGHEDFFMEGWCHGPSGTGRTLLALHALTGGAEWLDAARRAAAWVMQEKPAAKATRYYSPSLCCGAAGVVDFFVDMYRARRDPAHREYARAAAANLIDLSKDDGNGRKWTNYDHPDEKGIVYHGVSLMLGASGEGLALLRLAAVDRDVDPVVSLPDRAAPSATAVVTPSPAPPDAPVPPTPPTAPPIGPAAPPPGPPAAPGELVARADTPATGHDGDAYVVLTSRKSPGDPYLEAARRLAAWRKGTLVTGFDPLNPAAIASRLRELGARRVALVLPADEIDVNTHRRFLHMASRLDDDVFVDLSWGFVTGTKATSPGEMVERARAMEKSGVERRWISVAVASDAKGFVSVGAGDPTAKRAGWAGASVYWPCRESDAEPLDYARRTLKEIVGGGVVSFSGCGDPEGTWLFSDQRNMDASKHWKFDAARVGQDPKGEMPRARADLFRRMDLRGAVVWDGVCHSGSLRRVFVEGDIVSTFGTVDGTTEYLIPDGRSVGGAILDAGATAFIAPLGPNHGYATLVEAEAAFEGRLDLGDVVRSTWNQVAVALGKAPGPDLYLPGGGPVDPGAPMTGGAMNRVLYGDPALAPFAKETLAPSLGVERRDVTGVTGGFAVAVTVRTQSWSRWDMFGAGADHDRMRAVIALTSDDPSSLEVRVRATDAAGKSIAADRLSALVERIDGKRLLHLQVSAPRGLGLGEPGSTAEFTVSPAPR